MVTPLVTLGRDTEEQATISNSNMSGEVNLLSAKSAGSGTGP